MAFGDLINRQTSQTRKHHECYGYFEQKLSRRHAANAPFPTQGLIRLRAQFVTGFVCNCDATGSRTTVEREREAQHQTGGSVDVESPTTRGSDDDLHLNGSDGTGGNNAADCSYRLVGSGFQQATFFDPGDRGDEWPRLDALRRSPRGDNEREAEDTPTTSSPFGDYSGSGLPSDHRHGCGI